MFLNMGNVFVLSINYDTPNIAKHYYRRSL